MQGGGPCLGGLALRQQLAQLEMRLGLAPASQLLHELRRQVGRGLRLLRQRRAQPRHA